MTTILSGATFGAALVASGVYQPSVIIGQLKLENWHMLQAFLSAAASSTILVTLLGRQGRLSLKARNPVSLGIFATYDGNVIGGTLLGVGMALAGACPGTFLAQVALGSRPAFYAVDGGALAGIVFIGFVGPWIGRRKAEISNTPSAESGLSRKITVHEWLGISRTMTILGFIGVTAGLVVVTTLFAPPSPYAKIYPVFGGLLIGLSQLFSATVRSTLIGTSTTFEEIGKYFFWLLNGAESDKNPRSYNNLLFSVGIIGGAYGLAKAIPSIVAPTSFQVPLAFSTIGGFLMVLGSRIAGGCTSGHGISGMSLLSVSSVVTIGAAFVAGALVAPLVY